MPSNRTAPEATLSLNEMLAEILRDYELCAISPEASLIGRKKALGGINSPCVQSKAIRADPSLSPLRATCNW